MSIYFSNINWYEIYFFILTFLSLVTVDVHSIITFFPFKFQNQLMSLKLTKLTVWITVFPQALTLTTRRPRLPRHPLTPGLKWGPCRQQLKMQYIILCGVTGVFRMPSFLLPNIYFQQLFKNESSWFGNYNHHMSGIEDKRGR